MGIPTSLSEIVVLHGPGSSDTWPVDVTLEAAGYRVKLTHAGLEAADCRTDFTRGQGRAGRTTQLALTSEGLRLRPGDYQLTELGIASATGLSSRAA